MYAGLHSFDLKDENVETGEIAAEAMYALRRYRLVSKPI